MECQEKRMELFKLATMATLKTKSPADVGFGEALWQNYQIIESELKSIEDRLNQIDAEKAKTMPSKAITAH